VTLYNKLFVLRVIQQYAKLGFNSFLKVCIIFNEFVYLRGSRRKIKISVKVNFR